MFHCSRQNINYHLDRLKIDFPSTTIVVKQNRQNFVTRRGVELLEERISPVQATEDNESKEDKKETKRQKKKTVKETKNEQTFAPQANLDDLIQKIESLQETVDSLRNEIKIKDELLQQVIRSQDSLIALASQAQELVRNQQELSLMDKQQKKQLPGETELPLHKKIGIYAKAIFSTFMSEDE